MEAAQSFKGNQGVIISASGWSFVIIQTFTILKSSREKVLKLGAELKNNLGNKTIWMYWHQGFNNANRIIKICVQSWGFHNPDWELRLIDKDTVSNYIDGIDLSDVKLTGLSIQHRSDLIRTRLLIQHGGVWADPTCFCNCPLNDWLFEYLPSGLFLFSKPGRDRIIANWFIAAFPDNLLLKVLFDELLHYWKVHDFVNMGRPNNKFESLLNRIINRDPPLTRLWFTWFFTTVFRIYPYMVYHYKFYDIIRRYSGCKAIWKRTPFFSADGPHLLQRHGLLNPLTDQVRELIDAKKVPLFKLTWKMKLEEIPPNSVYAYLIKKITC